MSEFQLYRKKGIAKMRPYVPGEPMDGISISSEDKNAGSPKPGDMISQNPDNPADQYLVSAAFFARNYELLGPIV